MSDQNHTQPGQGAGASGGGNATPSGGAGGKGIRLFRRGAVSAAVAGEAGGKPAAGDMRAGMSVWNTSVFVAGLASDLAKPVADLAIPLFIAFLAITLVCGWLAFIQKPAVPFARTFVGTAGLGAAVFGFFLVAQVFATPQNLGQERGFIAAVAPPVAAVQTAVLPLSETEKELLNLASAISHGDAEKRAAAARLALAQAEDANLKRAMMERVVRNSDPNVRQVALAQAIADRGRGRLPLLTPPDDVSPLATSISGITFEFTRFDQATGVGSGYVYAAGQRGTFSANVANGRLILNSQYRTGGRWQSGLVIDMSTDGRMQLTGTARSPEGESVAVEAPLL